jgi:hypothetical protein
MKRNNPILSIVGVIITVWLATMSLQAQTLLINFANPATHTIAGTYLSGSYNPAGVDNGAWYTVNSDASSLTGNVTLDLGQYQSSQIKMSVNPSTNDLGSGGFTGLFGGTAPGHYGYFTSSAAGTATNVGGLAAGMYQVYVISANTNNTNPAATTISYFTNNNITFNDPNTILPGSYSVSSLAQGNGTGLDALANGWRDGVNYVTFTVNINAGDSLMILTEGGTAPINMLQIVAIPEPSIYFLVAIGLALLGWAYRYRYSKKVV